MARYRKVKVRIWADERFARLSPLLPSGQALWLYLLLAPEGTLVPGLIRTGLAGLAEALGWREEEAAEAWAEVEAEGMARADWRARLIWLPNAIRHNRPESPNVVLSWRGWWLEIPECRLKEEARLGLARYLGTMGSGYAAAFDSACPAWKSAKASRKASAEAMAKASRKASGKPAGEVEEGLAQAGEAEQSEEGEEEAAESGAEEQGERPHPGLMLDEKQGAGRRYRKPLANQDQDQDPPPLIPPPPSSALLGWLGEVYPDVAKPAAFERAALAAYPGVDLLAEAKAAAAWEAADPKRRKRAHGRFLNAWWKRAQQEAPLSRANGAAVAQESPPEWAVLLDRVRRRMRSDAFERWVAPLRAELTSDGAFVVRAPDRYAEAFVRDEYLGTLAEEAAALGHSLSLAGEEGGSNPPAGIE